MDEIKKFNKLVRDKIPDIIRSDGKCPSTEILSGNEYFSALKQKLIEETKEFHESEALEELADILEVVYSLSSCLGADPNKLEEIRHKKKLERGGFSERIFLIETELVGSL